MIRRRNKMKLIVGLGNPEKDYSETRHNMGFHVLNLLAKEYEIDISRNKFEAEFGTGIIEDEKVILILQKHLLEIQDLIF